VQSQATHSGPKHLHLAIKTHDATGSKLKKSHLHTFTLHHSYTSLCIFAASSTSISSTSLTLSACWCRSRIRCSSAIRSLPIYLSYLVDGFSRIRDLYALQKGIKIIGAGWHGQGFLELGVIIMLLSNLWGLNSRGSRVATRKALVRPRVTHHAWRWPCVHKRSCQR
jgi:hypothetical protein